MWSRRRGVRKYNAHSCNRPSGYTVHEPKSGQRPGQDYLELPWDSNACIPDHLYMRELLVGRSKRAPPIDCLSRCWIWGTRSMVCHSLGCTSVNGCADEFGTPNIAIVFGLGQFLDTGEWTVKGRACLTWLPLARILTIKRDSHGDLVIEQDDALSWETSAHIIIPRRFSCRHDLRSRCLDYSSWRARSLIQLPTISRSTSSRGFRVYTSKIGWKLCKCMSLVLQKSSQKT